MASLKVGMRVSLLFPLFFAFGVAACSEESSDAGTQAETLIDAPANVQPKADAPVGDLENGTFIFTVAHCTSCHSRPDDPETGRSGFMAGGDFGPGMYAANVTQDVETGIGGWSDANIETLLRTGVRPDGTIVHGIMPYGFIRPLTGKDMRDLIVYLRTIPAVNNVVSRTGEEAEFPADMFKNFPAPPTIEEAGETIARGGYLASLAHCMGCHTYIPEEGPQDFENQMGAGGVIFGGPEPVVSANITPHMEDGIGSYSTQDIVQLFRTGKRPDGTDLAPMMGTRDLEHLPQSDLEAIAAYLKWIPARSSPVPE